MNPISCPRENEVFEAVAAARWPEQTPVDLRSHVSECTICGDLVEVSQALQASYTEARRNVTIPSPGLVWWRAQMRSRREALRTVLRPIRAVEAITAASVAGASLALARKLEITAVSSLILERSLPLFVAIGAAVVLLPVALYFVFSDD